MPDVDVETYILGGDYYAVHDEVVWTKPEWAVGTKDEVTYIYLKGHGWVPETPLSMSLAREAKLSRQAMKAANFGTPYRWADTDFDQLEARIARTWAPPVDTGRMGWNTYVPVQIPREPRQTQNVWQYNHTEHVGALVHQYYQQRLTDTDYAPVRVTAPRTGTPAEPVATRYYPGAGVAPEHTTERQETIHERRIREWREASRRYRRGR